ncbi:MAG: extracellular solute-binding protein [Cyanobacteriota bacterium]|nr:extracellular solute-binding protein [Cyanobacteriota bacterium]
MKINLREQGQKTWELLFKKVKKNRIIFIAVLILTLIITVSVGTFFRETDAIYIAVAGPMSGDARFKGEDLARTTKMYVDEVNQAGGVNGKKLKLLIFDDEGRPELAGKKAQEIVEKTPAVAVIGHLFSNSSIATKDIYDRSGIAALTGTANADELTEGNKSYFRLGSSATMEGSFLANYLHSILQVSTASAIYDSADRFSTSIMTGFTGAFKGLEGEIKYEWNVKDLGVNPEEQYEQITRELLNNKDKEPGTIVVALRSKNAVDFVVALRRKGLNYPIIGGDNLGGDDVGNLFNFYPEERALPGYFSNGILASVTIIFDLADEETQELKNKYWEKYNLKSGWRTAANYDTAKVLVEAIKNAKIEGSRKNLSEERLLVRDSLASFNSKENAIEGLLGTLYFDEEGNAATTLSMGVFDNQKFISAFTQLSPVPDIRTVENLDEKLATGEIIIANNRYLQKSNVVYTGIDLNEIINLDQKTSSYTADFYLWFRYKGDIDASNIEFTNYSVERLDSGEKLELSEPIETKKVDGITYELYRLKADFKEQFLFDNYPFDRQKISVRFRHAHKTRQHLIYVVDFVGLQDISSKGILKKLKESQVFSTITDWQIKSAEIFQDTIKDNSTLGKKELLDTDADLEYSRFNLVVNIKRKFLSFSIKNLLPLLFFILVSYLLLFLPFEEISVEAVSGVLLAVVFFHLSLLEALPDGVGYVVALDYAFYVIYGLVILQMVMVVVGKKRIFEESKTKLKQLIKASRVIYLILLAIAIFGFAFRYEPIDLGTNSYNESLANLSSTSQATESKLLTTREKVTLKLGYVPSDYQTQMKQVLAEFNAKYPTVEVEQVPVNLTVNLDSENPLDNKILLRSLLKQDAATDLLLVEPFDLGKELFRTGDLETLDTTEEFNNFGPSVLTAWSTKDGELYALPMLGTAHGIYYNTEIFRELNLEVPTTWEDLQDTAERLQYYGYIPFANSSTNGQMLMDEMFLNILPNFIGGARGMQEYLLGDRCFNDEGAVAAFAAIADLEPFLATPQQASNYYESLNLFARGKAAMWFGSSGSVPLLNSYALEREWSVFAVPAPAGQQEYVRFTPELGVAINANSPHSQQAREFIEWLSTKEAALSIARELPGFFPLQAMESVKGDTGASAFIELMEKTPLLDSAWGLETLERGLPDGYSLMKQGVVGVAQGDRTPTETADNLQRGLAKWFKPAQFCRK